MSRTDHPNGATEEEDEQLNETRHPWSLTLGEFLRLVEERYGLKLHYFNPLDFIDLDIEMPYLQAADKQLKVYLPGKVGLEDQLCPDVTASLCRRIGIPPEDFGLPAEESFAEEIGFDSD
jgi:hypothetical protein